MADRYWVGGAGTWNATAALKWALTSGGLGGQAAPTLADDVYFDAGSGAVAVVIGAAGVVAKNLTFTGFTGSLSASTGALSCYGNLVMKSGLVSAWTGAINFLSTTAQTITSDGFTFNNSLTFNGVGGSWQLVDDLTSGTIRTVTLTNGTLDLNNKTLSIGLISSSNSNTRTLAFGTGNITLTGNNGGIIAMGNATNLSITGTPVINATYAGSTGSRNISSNVLTSGGTEAKAISLNVTAGTDTLTFSNGNSSYKNMIFTGFTGTITFANSATCFGNLTFNAGTTAISGAVIQFGGTTGTQQITTNANTVDAPINFNGTGIYQFNDALTQDSTREFTITSGTVQLKSGVTSTVGSFVANSSNVKYLQSTTPGTQATISQASGTVTVSDLTIQDSNAAGDASWTAYADYENIDAGNNDGWDFSLSPPYAAYEPPIIIRSFTQPRRF
jgi:hypothetical protein